MNAIIERQKRMLEATLGRVAGVSVEITFYKHNAISLLWDGSLEQPFSRLQKYFSGKLEGEYYDTEDDFSVCYLQLN